MANLFVELSGVNATKGYRTYDNIFEETRFDNKTDLYKDLVKEYGRCISKVYIDSNNPNKPQQIGWVFAKRVVYDDVRLGKKLKSLSAEARDKYSFLQETWVSVHTQKPTVVTTPHFAKF